MNKKILISIIAIVLLGGGIFAAWIWREPTLISPQTDLRLWGQGRPGTVRYGTIGAELGLCMNGAIRFGLSSGIATWEGAASQCPAGTWVCTWEERGEEKCDTARWDVYWDGMTCTGEEINIGFGLEEELGLVADSGFIYLGVAQWEFGGRDGKQVPVCEHRPVWCCSY